MLKENKDDLAAVIMEGVLGPAGSVPPTREFVETLREETARHGILLGFDEVVSGFRLARGGISELFHVRPDVVVLGKIIGGGFPVGAFLGPVEVMKEFERAHSESPMVGEARIGNGGTFNAFPVTMAAGLATLQELSPRFTATWISLEVIYGEC